jgi:hypothetical protein
VIAELVELLESRADSLEDGGRYMDSYEARRCAMAVRRAA